METATKLGKARVILAVADWQSQALFTFNKMMDNPLLSQFMETQGSGSLKLMIDQIKVDLLKLESKLEEEL